MLADPRVHMRSEKVGSSHVVAENQLQSHIFEYQRGLVCCVCVGGFREFALGACGRQVAARIVPGCVDERACVGGWTVFGVYVCMGVCACVGGWVGRCMRP